jgi:alpha-1,2-mannosyltransferase
VSQLQPAVAAARPAPGLNPLGGMIAAGPRRTMTLAVVGSIAWAGLAIIGWRLAQAGPPGVGFDLALLLEAGRHAAAGSPLYSPALVAGASVEAQTLFYSYPPFVAQALAPLAGLPLPVVLVAWSLGATAALAAVAVAIARRLASGLTAPAVALPVIALGPLVLPFGVGMLFGNLNVFFPALYGLLLLGALEGGRRGRVLAGIALGLAAATKLHPASLLLWFALRGVRQRRDGLPADAWEVVVIAVAAVAALAAFSLAVGGTAPWVDYLAVVRAGTGADLVDPRNMGPAGQLGLAFGLDAAAVRLVYLVVAIAAVGVTAWAAWRHRDPVQSLGWAALASLVTLPVTWYHYPAALLPVAIAALVRRPRRPSSVAWLAGAWLLVTFAIGTPALLAPAGAALLIALAPPVPGRSDAGPSAPGPDAGVEAAGVAAR